MLCTNRAAKDEGAKICDEEIAVVKHIAKKLNINVAASNAVAN